MWDALRRVNLAESCPACRADWTRVVEDGLGLSAGERARLALSRAVLAPRPLVLLDEPTAHLDTDTERIFLQTLHWLSQRSTVVVATHATSVLGLADQVICLPPVSVRR